MKQHVGLFSCRRAQRIVLLFVFPFKATLVTHHI